MKKSVLGLIVLIFLTITTIPVFAQDSDPVILNVAGEEITRSEFLNVYMKNNVNSEVLDRKSLEEYMELYINFRLKVKEAETLGLDTVRSFREELAGYRKQLAQPYLIDEEMNKSLLQEAYDRKKTDIRASHILIRVDRNAAPADTLMAYKKVMNLRKRILKGEDFGKVAMEASDDLSARDRQMEGRTIKGNLGDLGYFTVFDMVYPFETGAYNTPVGEVSMPVRSDFGYHLIKVTDRKPALGRVQVAHIMMRLPANATAEDSARIAAKAMEVYTRILNGEDFARMAEQNSDDKSTAAKGGVLPWFGANKMIPEFISEITKLKNLNDVSKPFLTSFGWHIVKLLDRKDIGAYEDVVNELKQSLTRSDRAKKSEEALLNRIRREYKYTENLKARDDFYKVVTDTIFSAKWSAQQAAGLKKTIMTIGRRSFTQQDFADWLAKNQRKRAKEDIRTFVNGMFTTFVNETLLAYEDSRLESKYPDFKMLVKEYRDGILLFELTDQKIWSKAVKDTTGLEAFYNQNKGNYMWDQRLDATVYTLESTDDKLIAGLRKAISGGLTDTELLAQFNTDTTSLLTIDHRKYQKGDNELIDSLEWKPGLAPESIDEGKVYLVNVHALLSPEPKKLNEARGLITADYQNYLEQEWIRELRARYPFKVNEEVLSSIK
ncbi:protein containing PPIC-type PPIASE domain [Lentimicrobium saccharophilum]|uniref:Protein containing PPIC-type PPIASE domain n=1 Tax=Lentimicrobium saccharophilum TaxID=1678841 RepID=A0A0S7C1F4_9BACT|nr:peptidylprolyl isomerase [Lentimicrobium saccharophilum]GAP43556.1 protein containing PPIC-type PPIASE domain [Lentimicrobium saccharophilum]